MFTKNRERMLDGNIAEAFFHAVLKQPASGTCSRPSTLPRRLFFHSLLGHTEVKGSFEAGDFV